MRISNQFVHKFQAAMRRLEENTRTTNWPHGSDYIPAKLTIEDFMEEMKYDLTEVLLAPAMQEMNGKYRSGRADTENAKNS